ncbi:MAG: hypothetical protein RLZZ324_1056 [Candidatus Parcubacteria bacterium]|jgi:DNA-binding CsgD family transcriptional regulator
MHFYRRDVLVPVRLNDGSESDARVTPREYHVIGLLKQGKSTRDIAAALDLTPATVHTYLKRIYKKSEVHSRIELVSKIGDLEAARSCPKRRTVEEDVRRIPVAIVVRADDAANIAIATMGSNYLKDVCFRESDGVITLVFPDETRIAIGLRGEITVTPSTAAVEESGSETEVAAPVAAPPHDCESFDA